MDGAAPEGGTAPGDRAGSRRERLRRFLRNALRDRPSPLELLVGPDRYLTVYLRAAGLWVATVGGAALLGLLLPRDDIPDLHAGPVIVLLGLLLPWTVVMALVPHRLPVLVGKLFPTLAIVLALVIVALVGPGVQVSTSVAVTGCVVSFVFLRRHLASITIAILAVGYAVVLGSAPGYPAPAMRWLVVVGSAVATSLLLSWLIRLLEGLASQERDARAELALAHEELAQLNEQLAEVVDEQGLEIGSLQQLRQFMSPQVAEAVLHDGMEALAAHRGRIAVIFCDLRGFTAFSSSAEPEEVMDVLGRYYATVGRAMQSCGATVGTFAGDGIMAYLGDPVPCEDPAGTVVELAIGLREPMGALGSEWRRRGFDLGCGIGIAYGYATIGPVGFDGRTDYTALGPTVNLASRLCGLALDGEILIDGRAHEAVEDRVRTEERVVELRGFRLPVHAYNVLEWVAPTGRHRGVASEP